MDAVILRSLQRDVNLREKQHALTKIIRKEIKLRKEINTLHKELANLQAQLLRKEIEAIRKERLRLRGGRLQRAGVPPGAT